MLKFVITDEGTAVLLPAIDPLFPNEPESDFPFLLKKLIRLHKNGDYVDFIFPDERNNTFFRITVYITLKNAVREINTMMPRLLVRLSRSDAANRKKIRKYNTENGNPVMADNFEISVDPAYNKERSTLFVCVQQPEFEFEEQD